MPVCNFRIITGNLLWLYILVTWMNYEISCYKGVKPFSVCTLRVRVILYIPVLRQSYDVTVELCIEGTGKHDKAVTVVP